MSSLHLAVVSDTHLSSRTPDALENWDAVVQDLQGQSRPADAVLHLGDLTVDGQHETADLELGRRQLERIGSPWWAIPGNHDVGDNPGGSRPEWTGRPEDRNAWLRAVGVDRWRLRLGHWTLVGLNVQLFGTGWPDEEDQWQWLAGVLEETPPSHHVMLALHKPLGPSLTELTELTELTGGTSRFVPGPAAQRLDRLMAGHQWRAVVSGHVHELRSLSVGAVAHCWAPSTWGVVPAQLGPAIGSKVCGYLWLELDDQGAVKMELRTPSGLRQHTIGVDTTDPYGLLDRA